MKPDTDQIDEDVVREWYAANRTWQCRITAAFLTDRPHAGHV